MNLVLPLVNWGMGTALIIIFAVVCVVLTAIVVGMVLKGKSKNESNSSQKEHAQPPKDQSK